MLHRSNLGKFVAFQKLNRLFWNLSVVFILKMGMRLKLVFAARIYRYSLTVIYLSYWPRQYLIAQNNVIFLVRLAVSGESLCS